MENWKEVLDALEEGRLRAAEKSGDGDGERWVANVEAKKGILQAFKEGELTEYQSSSLGFVDKHNLGPQQCFETSRQVRVVPGGSAVRRGAYIAKGVIVMPPSYINTGAYVDEGSLVDSHVLVGSCAQIGKRVHLSAGVQIGGVLEPVGLSPVIVEDEAFIGAGAVIVEGVQVGRRAVVAPGVILSKGTLVFDCVHERALKRDEAIPADAVVVPGSRPVKGRLSWAQAQGFHLGCALIVKYRDEKSDASLELEQLLR